MILSGSGRGARAPVFYLATLGHTASIGRLLASPVGASLGGLVVPVVYEEALRRMTRAFWLGMAKEAWWNLPRAWWSPGDVEVRPGWRRLLWRLYRTGWASPAPPRGVYIFADVEVLSTEEARRAAVLWTALAESGRGVRLLNHPLRSMRRYELLRTLHERGWNRFDVYRASEAREPARYPVFVRRENDHGGARSPLLWSRREVPEAVAALEREGLRRDEILITEFCDTADPRGVYRKYSVFCVGDRIFPKNVHFSRHWVLKLPDLTEPDMLAEERRFVETNPHADRLRAIFELARINYGRADYALLDGEVQVWEINTNPHITSVGPKRHGPRKAIYEAVEGQMTAALLGLADAPGRALQGDELAGRPVMSGPRGR